MAIPSLFADLNSHTQNRYNIYEKRSCVCNLSGLPFFAGSADSMHNHSYYELVLCITHLLEK